MKKRNYTDLGERLADTVLIDFKGTADDPPPLPPMVTEQALQEMAIAEQADYFGALSQISIARYGGRPGLLLKENPSLDFRQL